MEHNTEWAARDRVPAAVAAARFVVARGMVGVDSPRLLALLPGLALWLAGPWLLARAAGRAGWQGAQSAVERWWARRLLRHLRVRLDVAGLEQIDPGAVYVVAPLHEGFADVLALLQLPLRLRFAARDELFGWRLLGPLLRDTGQLEVSPERSVWSYRQLLRGAIQLTARGASVVVFPQGTILGIESDFRRGAFALAKALDLPILPVMVTGSHRVWEHPYTPRLRYGERMSLRVLPPIDVTAVRARSAEELRRAVQADLKAAALGPDVAAPRRFVPARDGYWDGYAFRIDPEFRELAADIARHRAVVAAHARGASQPLGS